MRVAYIDTSCLVAIALDAPGSRRLAAQLKGCSLFSSNLLEAEFRSTLVREGVEMEPTLISSLTWIYPNRSLTPELQRIFAHGYRSGAHAWHLACALFFAREPREILFFTLDRRQRGIAAALGFQLR